MDISYGELIVMFLIILISVLTGYGMGVAKVKDQQKPDPPIKTGPDLSKGDHI
jgi:hypothetical protein